MSRTKITIPNTSVSENLTGFPVYIDLSSLGDSFWDSMVSDDGYDIRVRDINNTSDTDSVGIYIGSLSDNTFPLYADIA